MTTSVPRRASAIVLLGVLTAASLAACSSSSSDGAGPAPTPSKATTSTTSTTSTPSTPAASSTPNPSATPTSSPSTVPAASGSATCRADQLRVRYADDQGGGAAGSVYGSLVLTNTSSSSCAMTGWPGVSYVGGGDGQQIGAAADRTGQPTVIVLKPGGAATAQLREAEAGDFGGSCSPTAADGLRVYPPNSRTSVFVKHPTQACRSASAHQLTIGPVHSK